MVNVAMVLMPSKYQENDYNVVLGPVSIAHIFWKSIKTPNSWVWSSPHFKDRQPAVFSSLEAAFEDFTSTFMKSDWNLDKDRQDLQ